MSTTPRDLVHKAAPQDDRWHCAVCGQPIKQVPGGSGSTWVHSDSGAVAAPNPPGHHPVADHLGRVLTASDVLQLARIIEAAHQGRRVWRVDADYDHRIDGVARHLVLSADRPVFLASTDDVRDAYLRVSGLLEYFWPVAELLADIHTGRFGIED